MLRVHTDVFVKVYWYSINSVTTMVVTHCPRTLTYVSNTNPYLKASLQPDICSDEDIQVIKISTPNLEFIHLCHIYNETPRYDHSQPYTIERKLKHITLPPRTILAGDFNAHHMWWNSRAHRSLRHETLIQILEEGDYDLINEEDTPKYHYSNGSVTTMVVTELIVYQ